MGKPQRMPLPSYKKRRAPSSLKKRSRTSNKARRLVTRRRRRSGTLGDIHTFKGILNAGYINSATSGHLGGQYIFKLSDFPIIGTGGNGLGESFDFVRLNKCKMEFLPRSNMAQDNTQLGITFLTGLDEVPLTTTSSALTAAPTWQSQGGEDTDVTEGTAYDHVRITADYIRGQPMSQETEPYKKHVHWFTPTFYDYVVSNVTTADVAPAPSSGIFQRCQRKWVNLNFLSQNAGAEVQSLGPDFYGPMYCLSTTAGSATSIYDVKVHYSVSFRRLRGI